MRSTSLLLIAALAACSPKGANVGESVNNSAANSALPAPIPSDVAIRITGAQNGQSAQVPVGQRFAIALVGIPTAGYVWEATEVPSFIERAGDAGGPTHRDQLQPGFAGGSHWEVLIFRVDAAGSGVLRLEQRRPWETNKPAANTFSVTIEAR